MKNRKKQIGRRNADELSSLGGGADIKDYSDSSSDDEEFEEYEKKRPSKKKQRLAAAGRPHCFSHRYHFSRTHSPHPPPWPSLTRSLTACSQCICAPMHTRRFLLPGLATLVP
jgi:hypothetical protein